jgi:4-amino-4-deoxy-L-arabinose transferase-like glycosyltransferase
LQALSYPLFGPVEWAARMPNFVTSILLVPATGLLAWRLFKQDLVVVLGAAFVAFSPLTTQFSGTAYTDPLLSFWITMSLVAVSYSVNLRFFNQGVTGKLRLRELNKSALLAGIFFGLAAATKYQAWLFLPLIIGLAFIGHWRWSLWKRLMVGILICLLIVLAWELIRSGTLTLINEQISSFGGLRLSYSWELWPRLEAWARQWRFVLDSEIISFFVILTLPLYLALLIHDEDKTTAIDQIFVLFLIAYFVLHWFIAIPAWDRYLLPLMPIVGLIFARFILRVAAFIKAELPILEEQKTLIQNAVWFVPLILIVLLGQGIRDAYEGRLPVGGQPDADQGISSLVNELKSAPYGTVLYDHWYSWQLRYYLFESGTYISWFLDPDSLQEDLQVFGRNGNSRYLVAPETKTAEPIFRAIEESGFKLIKVDQEFSKPRNSHLALYLIEPR